MSYMDAEKSGVGGKNMAFETKVLLATLAEAIVRSNNVKEAYNILTKAANVEGIQLPSYEDKLKEIENDKQ
jgi:hypothetical protein